MCFPVYNYSQKALKQTSFQKSEVWSRFSSSYMFCLTELSALAYWAGILPVLEHSISFKMDTVVNENNEATIFHHMLFFLVYTELRWHLSSPFACLVQGFMFLKGWVPITNDENKSISSVACFFS